MKKQSVFPLVISYLLLAAAFILFFTVQVLWLELVLVAVGFVILLGSAGWRGRKQKSGLLDNTLALASAQPGSEAEQVEAGEDQNEEDQALSSEVDEDENKEEKKQALERALADSFSEEKKDEPAFRPQKINPQEPKAKSEASEQKSGWNIFRKKDRQRQEQEKLTEELDSLEEFWQETDEEKK